MFSQKKKGLQVGHINFYRYYLGQDNQDKDCIAGDVPSVLDGKLEDHRGPYGDVNVTMGCLITLSSGFGRWHHLSFLNVFLSQIGLLSYLLVTKYL